MGHPRSEVEAAVERYVATRARIAAGEASWPAMADLFSERAVYIDPAWGRVQGRDEIATFMDESMRGLEDWDFPITFTAIEGDWVVIKWTQVLPGGSRQSGVSTLRYAGDGRFDYGEDLLNMAHVLEDLATEQWRPGPGFIAPPATPNRDWSLPG